LFEVLDVIAKCFLHVDDEECRPRKLENIWVLHVIDFEVDLSISDCQLPIAGLMSDMRPSCRD